MKSATRTSVEPAACGGARLGILRADSDRRRSITTRVPPSLYRKDPVAAPVALLSLITAAVAIHAFQSGASGGVWAALAADVSSWCLLAVAEARQRQTDDPGEQLYTVESGLIALNLFTVFESAFALTLSPPAFLALVALLAVARLLYLAIC